VSNYAQLVATNVAAIKAVFPNVQYVDAEPVPGTTGIMQFAQDFQQDTGQPLAAFVADVQWGQQWQAPLESLAESLQAAGIQFDVIDTGDPATTSVGWVQEAIERMAAVESDPLLNVDALLVSTWTDYPAAALPDNNPTTLTYLALVDANMAPLFRNGTLSPLANDAPLISAPTEVSTVLGLATPIPGITVSLDEATPTGTNVAVMCRGNVDRHDGSAICDGHGWGYWKRNNKPYPQRKHRTGQQRSEHAVVCRAHARH
jgi:hypothetical protein